MIKTVFVIIVTYNGAQWIEKCIHSLLSSKTKLSIIVVDNCSHDNTIEIIKNSYSEIVVLEQDTNLGFGQANNIGIKYAINHNANFVFLLNQDTYVNENTIEKLIHQSIKNNEYGILSPIHFNWEGNKLERHFSRNMYYNNLDYFTELINGIKKEKIYNVNFMHAAAWLIPAKVFQIVGGFDPIFFHYGEDVNYCQRVLSHKFNIGIVSDCIVYHDTEDRKKINDVLFSEDYFYKLNNTNKIDFGNLLDNEYVHKLKMYKRKLIKRLFVSICWFNFNAIKGTLKELHYFKIMREDVINSREINKIRGSHYLKLN